MAARHTPHRFIRKALVSAVIAACATPALAFDFKTDSGWEGNVKTDLTFSQAWRVEEQDKSITSSSAAAYAKFGTAGDATGQSTERTALRAAGWGRDAKGNGGNMNWDKGDRYETIAKFLSEISINKGEMGGMLRVKGWYDDAAKNHDVPYGNQPSGFARGKPLSDQSFESRVQFNGLALHDAYIYNTFHVADMPLQIRLGNQVVNWGESIFVQGINQLNPIDLASASKAGTQIKEALLPVWAINANMSFGNGISAEGFYQFKWDPHAMDGCGAWGGGDGNTVTPGMCDIADTVVGLTDPGAQAINTYLPYVNSKDARDSGQWGVALRFPVEAIDTEFGLYAMNIHSRVPFVSGNVGGNLMTALGNIAPMINGALPATQAGAQAILGGVIMTPFKGLSAYLSAGGLPALQTIFALSGLPYSESEAFVEYPEDIRTYAISAATTVAGWSVGAELSHTRNQPVQLSGADLLHGIVEGIGPIGSTTTGGSGLISTGSIAGNDLAPNTGYHRGWESVKKTQFQVNGLNTLPAGFLGASGGLVIGEVIFQWADLDSSKRYGRAFAFDAGNHPSYSSLYSAQGNCPTTLGSGCKNDGFMTDFAWGYRLDAELTYPGMFGTGWEFKPSVYWAHDVKGVSVDYQLNEDYKTLSLGAAFVLNNVHRVAFNYTTYSNGAEFNTRRDRDNVSVYYRYTF